MAGGHHPAHLSATRLDAMVPPRQERAAVEGARRCAGREGYRTEVGNGSKGGALRERDRRSLRDIDTFWATRVPAAINLPPARNQRFRTPKARYACDRLYVRRPEGCEIRRYRAMAVALFIQTR